MYSIINKKKDPKKKFEGVTKYGINIDVSDTKLPEVNNFRSIIEKIDEKIKVVVKEKYKEIKTKEMPVMGYWTKCSWNKEVAEEDPDKKDEKAKKDTIGKFQIFIKDDIVDKKINFVNFNNEKIAKDLANKRKKLIEEGGDKKSPESEKLKKEYLKIKKENKSLTLNKLDKLIAHGTVVKKLTFYIGNVKIIQTNSIRGYGYDLYLNELSFIPSEGEKKIDLDDGMSEDEDEEKEETTKKITKDIKDLKFSNYTDEKIGKKEEESKKKEEPKKKEETKKQEETKINKTEYNPSEENDDEEYEEEDPNIK
jgi:hypothetical protein